MPQLNEAEAERLSPDQAGEMIRILELQARWENHRDDPAKSTTSASDLHVRQRAFEEFQVALRKYGEKYRNARLPEPTQNMPDRLAIWCRALRVVFRRAEGGNPSQAMAKVYRLADRIALRMAREPVGRGKVDDLVSAAQELDAVIEWCDSLGVKEKPLAASA